MALLPARAALVAQIIEDEEADEEEIMMMIARVAAMEIMDAEGDEGLEDLAGASWVPVTVINEYHQMGDPVFKMHFRTSRTVFEALTCTIRNYLLEKRRLVRERTAFGDIMLMVVWLLATPDTFRSVSLRFGVVPGTLYYFYSYVIEALRELAPRYISWPNAAERNEIKDRFYQVTGFPGVIGCIDGTHVYITAPVNQAARYRNKNKSYSINVQAVVDHNLLVRDLHVGEVGSMHDTRVFRRSQLHQDLLLGNRLSPDEHLVGDGGYILTDFMIIPFKNNGHLTAAQLEFNRRLSQGRVRVENSFALAKGKWRRLKFMHARNQAHLIDHITASFVLHNFLILEGETMFDDEELGRPINHDQVLGVFDFDGNNEDILEENADEQHLLNAAQGRGEEKRAFIMDNFDNFVQA